MQRYTEEQTEQMKDELSRVLTIKDVMRMYDKSLKTVQIAIWQGRLYAEKRDTDEGVRGGVWLVSQRSAQSLWGADFVSDETERS